MIEQKKQYEIEIFDMSTAGEGIGRIDGMVVFVPGTVPGDRATVEITEIKKHVARGAVVRLEEPSASRVEPRCTYAEKCGGCSLQAMSYEAQLQLKEKQLRDKLERIYGGELPEPEPIIGMEEPWRFRNKTAYAVYAGKALLQKDGSVKNAERPRVGFFNGSGRQLVEAEECPISGPAAEAAADALREYIRQTGISVYDEKTKKGRLRQLVVRTGFESHEVMVVIVINGKKVPKPELLADLMYDAIDHCNDALEAQLDESEREIFDRWYEMKSLIVNYNGNRTLAEISTKHDILYGMPVIRDTCAGMEFEISPFSFYQVNPLQMEKLYRTVVDFADLKGTETVFDLYCGVGTIGLFCARHAGQVWGIESVKSAVLDANRNAVLNGLVNIRFLHGKAEEKIFELMAPQTTEEADEACIPDVVIMDPPRAGCHPDLLHAVMQAAPEKIIYVSCDPGTLARDLKILTGMASEGIQTDTDAPKTPNLAGGKAPAVYRIQRIRPVDNFCHSLHIEAVTLLTRAQAK